LAQLSLSLRCGWDGSDATTAEKQIVANDLAAKVVAMSQSGDVILLAATIILRTGPLWNGRASTK
jgi:hypothetical protein